MPSPVSISVSPGSFSAAWMINDLRQRALKETKDDRTRSATALRPDGTRHRGCSTSVQTNVSSHLVAHGHLSGCIRLTQGRLSPG